MSQHDAFSSVRKSRSAAVSGDPARSLPAAVLALALLAAAPAGLAQCQEGLSTVAGRVALGDGGPAGSSLLRSPKGVAFDGRGNWYIADTLNHRVRKVDQAGVITTLAGTGIAGAGGDGGPAEWANLYLPYGVAVDEKGNVYIADFGNHRVRKVSADGIITTIAGTGVMGFSGDDGPAVSARLNQPYSVAVDPEGNLFIADFGNGRVRKVDRDGIITTVAGSGYYGATYDGGVAVYQPLKLVTGVAVDAAGNLYIADPDDHRVRKVNKEGIITTVAGNGVRGFSGDGGNGTEAQLFYPRSVAVDAEGNVYIADSGNLRIRRVDTAGVISTVAGAGIDGRTGDGIPAAEALLTTAEGVAVDETGAIYIAEWSPNRIRKVDAAGIIRTVAGAYSHGFSGDGGPANEALLNGPMGLAATPEGVLYVADTLNHRVRKIDAAGIISTVAGTGEFGYGGDGGPAVEASFKRPQGLALDSAGNLYIADRLNHRIRKLSPDGLITTVAGNGSAGFSGDGGPAVEASLSSPWGVFVDSAGNLFIADTDNNRIRKVDAAGVITTVAGTGDFGFAGDGGPATAARLAYPRAVLADGARNLYIGDGNNRRVRKVDASGTIWTVAGIGLGGDPGDGGPAAAATLGYPVALALDRDGNLFLAELLAGVVRKIDRGNVITTVAGTGIRGHSGDAGPGGLSQIGGAYALAFDAAGNLYFADGDFHAVRKLNPSCQPVPAAVFRDSDAGISMLNVSSGQLFSLGGYVDSSAGAAMMADGRLVVAARDGEGSVWMNVADPRDGTAEGWRPLGGVTQGIPAVAVSRSALGTVALVVSRDLDGGYWVHTSGADYGEGGWSFLEGRLATDPAAAACADGTVYVVGRDAEGGLWSRRWIPGLGWGPWAHAPGAARGAPSVTCGRSQLAYVAVREEGDTLWLPYVNGGVWQDWKRGEDHVEGDPEIASTGIGRVYVTYRDSSDLVRMKWYEENFQQGTSSWLITNGLSGNVTAAAAGGALYLAGVVARNSLWRYMAGLQYWEELGWADRVAGRIAGAPR